MNKIIMKNIWKGIWETKAPLLLFEPDNCQIWNIGFHFHIVYVFFNLKAYKSMLCKILYVKKKSTGKQHTYIELRPEVPIGLLI